MKPLRMKVYPKTWKPGYGFEDKRLTPAEIAAEYHAEARASDGWMERCYPHYSDASTFWPRFKESEQRAATLKRFATLPHYDEQPNIRRTVMPTIFGT